MGLDSSKENNKHAHLPSEPHRYLHEESGVIPAPLTVIRELRHTGPVEGIQPLKVAACSFSPDDDTTLVTVTTLATPPFRTLRAGFVQCWDLEKPEEGHDSSLFTYSPRPNCPFSPDGELLSIILNSGAGQLILVEREGCCLEPCNIQCTNGDRSLCARALCCVFSNDGKKAVTVSNVTLELYRGREIHEICLWRVCSKRKVRSIWKVSCEVALPRFAGHFHSCVFSPDSSLLAISSSLGQLYIVQGNSLELFAAIDKETIPNNACTCAFDPRFGHKRLGASHQKGDFRIWELEENPGKFKCVKKKDIVEEPVELLTFAFSPDGYFIAFGLSDGKTLICDSISLHCIHELNPGLLNIQEDESANMNQIEALDFAVTSLAFAKSCQEIAVGHCNGILRIWQLPLRMDLMHICRIVITSLVSGKKIHLLPLPNSLKRFLLFSYINLNREFLLDAEESL